MQHALILRSVNPVTASCIKKHVLKLMMKIQLFILGKQNRTLLQHLIHAHTFQRRVMIQMLYKSVRHFQQSPSALLTKQSYTINWFIQMFIVLKKRLLKKEFVSLCLRMEFILFYHAKICAKLTANVRCLPLEGILWLTDVICIMCNLANITELIRWTITSFHPNVLHHLNILN